MNRASRWGTLALAVAFVGGATANLYADMSLPPARFDIGGDTEAETLARFDEIFNAVLIRVPVDEVLPTCSDIQMERTGQPYPAEEGRRLLGCLIRDNWGAENPVIIYPTDPGRPWLTNQILRHEIAHLLGWSNDHRRD